MGHRGKQSLLRIKALVAGQCRRCKAVSADSAGVADRDRGRGGIQASRQALGRSLIADSGIHRVRGRPDTNGVRY